jgi:MoaA/NifB/PqqE/SkfB family radical SAM enzyme
MPAGNLLTPNYDVWLHWKITQRCYMGCEYCFEHHLGGRPLEPIDLPRLMQSLDATGKTFKISFTGGGEPFLVPNLTEVCLELAKKHYLAFNTDFCEAQVHSFLEQIDASRVLLINASCHIEAMKRRRVLDRYIENCLLAREKGIPFALTEVGYPPLRERVGEYREIFAAHGLELVFNTFYGSWEGRDYPAAYTEEEIEAFHIDRNSLDAFYPDSLTLCNAGSTALVVETNGDVLACDMIRKPLGNIYTGFKLLPRVIKCPSKTCSCPLNLYDAPLFERTLRRDGVYVTALKGALQVNHQLNRFGLYRGAKALARRAATTA